MNSDIHFDETIITELMTTKMPFGRYEGVTMKNLPEHYVMWFYRKGLPQGRLGQLLGTLYEIKLNGLEYLLERRN
jgi:uncharacterized protein (DUF3820 family)